MMHGLALLSLHKSVVHSQANLNNIYFDHININTYNYLENKITWLRGRDKFELTVAKKNLRYGSYGKLIWAGQGTSFFHSLPALG